jgi:hypothetical protein
MSGDRSGVFARSWLLIANVHLAKSTAATVFVSAVQLSRHTGLQAKVSGEVEG